MELRPLNAVITQRLLDALENLDNSTRVSLPFELYKMTCDVLECFRRDLYKVRSGVLALGAQRGGGPEVLRPIIKWWARRAGTRRVGAQNFAFFPSFSIFALFHSGVFWRLFSLVFWRFFLRDSRPFSWNRRGLECLIIYARQWKNDPTLFRSSSCFKMIVAFTTKNFNPLLVGTLAHFVFIFLFSLPLFFLFYPVLLFHCHHLLNCTQILYRCTLAHLLPFLWDLSCELDHLPNTLALAQVMPQNEVAFDMVAECRWTTPLGTLEQLRKQQQ